MLFQARSGAILQVSTVFDCFAPWDSPAPVRVREQVLRTYLIFPQDNLGAILAVTDWLSRESLARGKQPLTIRTVLTALVKAYEIQGCFQIKNAFNKVGLDHTMLVKVAATAVTSWLLGLSEIQAQDALSQAWMDGAPLRAFRQSPNTGPRKGWAAGDACMRAVHLAFLTKNGQPGAPTILTTPRWGFYNTLFQGQEFRLPRPFKSWVVENVFFKIHAVEGHGASGVEAAAQIGQTMRARNLDPDKDIAHIRVRTQQAAMIIINKQGPLHNSADRDHCMQYMIAVVLLKGSMIEARDYRDDSPWARDPRVEALRKRIDLEEDAQFTADYHNREKSSASSALKVSLTDGSDLDEVLVERPVGHPWRDDTMGLVKAKFEHNVKAMFGDGEQSRAILGMASLEEEAFAKIPVYEFVNKFAKCRCF